jgi:hypothetical protein
MSEDDFIEKLSIKKSEVLECYEEMIRIINEAKNDFEDMMVKEVGEITELYD